MKNRILIILGIFAVTSCSGRDKSDDIQNREDVVISQNMEEEIPESSQPINAVNAAENKNVVKAGSKVTFIELGSANCIPCKMMQPVMDEVRKKYPKQVDVIFYDVWTEKGAPMAEKFRIRVIPTQVFLDSDGNEYFRHEGFFEFAELEKVLKSKDVK